MQERTQLEKQLDEVRGLEQGLEDAMTLAELGDAEGDDASVDEALAEMRRIQAITEKMELEMGRDLQYIRINGTLVGGLVGLVLHTAIGLI